jgi:ribosomal protein S12 methylthiotransferase
VRISLLSLGCPKNLVDSERVIGAFADADLVICPHPEDAEVVVVNTCGFLKAAVDESVDTIRQMVDLKERAGVKAVVVTGCLPARDGQDVLSLVPGVDAAVPFGDYDRLVEICRRAGGLEPGPDYRRELLTSGERIPLTPRGSAYLKISEGCGNPCSFCTIPAIRGDHVSRPEEELVREARDLALAGVKELVLIGQDTTYYGFDLHREFRLASLLRALAAIPGIEWVRLLYGYPAYVTDELLEVIAGERRVLPYLDLPLQHVADGVLRRMKRPLGGPRTRKLVERIRERVPGIVLRTTLIVGAPGEGEEEFRELLEFVGVARFERLGVFTYSPEPDTPLGRDPGQVPEEVKHERWRTILERQQEIAFDDSARQVGRTLACLVEEPPVDGVARGRTWRDAPEIDGAITIRGAPGPGSLGEVEVARADGYDLEGEWIG